RRRTRRSRPKRRASASITVVLPELFGPTKTAWRPSAISADRIPLKPDIFTRVMCMPASQETLCAHCGGNQCQLAANRIGSQDQARSPVLGIGQKTALFARH